MFSIELYIYIGVIWSYLCEALDVLDWAFVTLIQVINVYQVLNCVSNSGEIDVCEENCPHKACECVCECVCFLSMCVCVCVCVADRGSGLLMRVYRWKVSWSPSTYLSTSLPPFLSSFLRSGHSSPHDPVFSAQFISHRPVLATLPLSLPLTVTWLPAAAGG